MNWGPAPSITGIKKELNEFDRTTIDLWAKELDPTVESHFSAYFSDIPGFGKKASMLRHEFTIERMYVEQDMGADVFMNIERSVLEEQLSFPATPIKRIKPERKHKKKTIRSKSVADFKHAKAPM